MKRWGLTFPLDGISLPAHKEILQEAEQLGYTDAWTMEVDGVDAFVPAALGLSWTTELRIGTAIANVFIRGPASLAQTAAGVNEVAGGRFVLGIGASSPAIVENWNGIEFEKPYTRVRETLAFLREAFTGERVSSETLGVRGFRMRRRFADAPPVFVAALQEKMLTLAGSASEGVIINWLAPYDVPKVVSVAKDAAKEAGRDPEALEVVCRIFVIPTEDENVARFIARRSIAGYFTTPVYGSFHRWLGRGEALLPMQEAWDAGDRQKATELVPDEVIDGVFVMGSPQACLDQIEEYCKNGVTVPVLNFIQTAQDPKGLAALHLKTMKELARP
ncbi:MAG: LLM class F420-dependent oxidoreductase [Chloroflexi bacterium]|nr:LLM class F420-dependent oxidoreductase [Chloroflexota bacterium]